MNRKFLLLLMVSLFAVFFSRAQRSLSGDYYDWKKTMKPERPWVHDYSQTLVMKLFLCSRDSVGNIKKVYLTFDGALAMIKRLDALTLGMPKIVYLVGWQFNGHDSGYPSWATVNSSLKRKQDTTAVQSLRWLMREGRHYHTTISLHINMIDAYRGSPLWAEYDNQNVIIKDKSGKPIPGEIMGNMPSYQINYAQEWKTGLAQKRIKGLLDLLPELRKGGSIHIDAFHSIQPVRSLDTVISDPYLRLTVNDEIATQRKIFRYWRDFGVDVTSEGGMYWLRKDPFIGLQPMAWHFDLDEFRRSSWIGKPAGFDTLPPQLYCGTPMPVEEVAKQDPVKLSGLVQQFCTEVVPWYYKNNSLPKGDESYWQQQGDIFLPALWLRRTIVAYSEKGYTGKTWKLPAEYAGITSAKVSEISADRPGTVQTVAVKAGTITLDVQAGQGLEISL